MKEKTMNTPVYDYILSYAGSGMLRMHMPGHKGRTFDNLLSDIYRFDLTEITGAGNLFEYEGIIYESEKNAAELFSTKGTFYSTQGSTLCIQTMLALMKRENRRVFAVRNVHRSFLSSCALLNIEPVWIYPEYSDTIISGRINLSDVIKSLEMNPHSCLYVTSPDYLGAMADIKSLAEICHSYDSVLLVDNAHGACLPFYSENRHPVHLGADLCCDSAHKMLPALTGAAYLHTGNERYTSQIKDAMLMFASTSPSYLVTCSLDLCNRYLACSIKEELAQAEKLMAKLRSTASEKYSLGCPAFDLEPLHFTINAEKSGVSGRYLAEKLRENGIEYEFADDTYIVLLFSPADGEEEYRKTAAVLESIEFRPEINEPSRIVFPHPEKVLSIRDALFSEYEEVSTECAEGRICAGINVPCPPAVPVAVSGERISAETIRTLVHYGISTVRVVKNRKWN